MPLIPGVNQRSVAPDAANTPYFKIDPTADEFGAGVGKSMLGLGSSLIDGATTALDVTQKLTAKAKAKAAAQDDNGYHIDLPMPQFSPDLSKAIEATNTFNAGAQDLTSNYLQLSGKDAVDGQEDAQQGIDQLKDHVLANASTPAAADLARRAVTQWADGTKSIIDRHAIAQQRVYDDDLDNTQMTQGRDAVRLLYNDDQHYLTQLHVASQARADQILRAAANDNPAADPETIAATIASAQQATASDFTRTRIEGALGQGDLATATALKDRWGGDLLPADQDAVSQHLTYASFNQQSQQAGTQAMAINQPSPLGRQRNADRVLHRSGGGSAAGEQGSISSIPPDALSPLSVGPDGKSMTRQQMATNDLYASVKPIESEPGPPMEKLDKGERDERALQYPEGGWDEHSPGERMVIGPQAMAATAALKNNRIAPVEASPLSIDLKVNPRDSSVVQGEGHYGDNRDRGQRRHEGVDFAAPVGTSVFAVKDGIVLSVVKNVESTGSKDGYGNQVVIQHLDGSITVYAHLRPMKDAKGSYVSPVDEGQYVGAGEKIGEVGKTGNVGRAASHLHFETRFESSQDVQDDNWGQRHIGRTTFNPLYLFRKSGITIDGIEY